jgi:hypothetical protein
MNALQLAEELDTVSSQLSALARVIHKLNGDSDFKEDVYYLNILHQSLANKAKAIRHKLESIQIYQ